MRCPSFNAYKHIEDIGNCPPGPGAAIVRRPPHPRPDTHVRMQANVNAIDRFRRTPLEDAVRGDHKAVVQLLISNGAKVYDGEKLIDITNSKLAGAFR